ncbi:PEGA domain-containing protein [Ornithobacterium rhinotracheale]|uniref:PEGA domain-containing protein n=1 Tax=Ornithobacterium rhinotracheale TaxID=28251 RepID=UPI001FF4227D|nr:PEGA domain-containing protein [Ornithobacterium rhinotracheale]MCK0203765.1 PEGA domain-containing protein [Ornithobacterium rhinotracheale]MCK0205820.1 PEGA domain-containing protein [Ornithobacterium rhinotracheale]
MKRTLIILSMLGGVLLPSSCATIVSKSNYPLTIISEPSDATVTIKDKKDTEVFSGRTPATVQLNASSGFFGKGRYQIKIEKKGFDTKVIPVEAKLDGWYFGNILFGGFIGMLIVDPATGAMYKLDKEPIVVKLEKTTAVVNSKELRVYSLNQIPKEWHQYLVKISE